ncbi:hypothetical protein [Priestia koreensis]|uniref:Uncharacterized protein n=1 Tax=Priestia koreensis TaxID=284581 RepID=A0A0M0LIK6_9BACI|nr:hypothetical protein [Priestia koreensis]KOO50816.1 hypothetical protein AMD01_03525 [Priestia koreensis]
MRQVTTVLKHKKENHFALSSISKILHSKTVDEWFETMLNTMLYVLAVPYIFYVLWQFLQL